MRRHYNFGLGNNRHNPHQPALELVRVQRMASADRPPVWTHYHPSEPVARMPEPQEHPAANLGHHEADDDCDTEEDEGEEDEDEEEDDDDDDEEDNDGGAVATPTNEFQWVPSSCDTSSKKDVATITTPDLCSHRFANTGLNIKQKQRREDYLVIGGEDTEPKTATAQTQSLGMSMEHSTAGSYPRLWTAPQPQERLRSCDGQPCGNYPGSGWPMSTASLDRRPPRSGSAVRQHAPRSCCTSPVTSAMTIPRAHLSYHSCSDGGSEGGEHRRKSSQATPVTRKVTSPSSSPSPTTCWAGTGTCCDHQDCQGQRRRRRSGHYSRSRTAPVPCRGVMCGCVHHCYNGDHVLMEYVQWKNCSQANGLGKDYGDLQEKVRRLEGDKDNLALQVNVLSDQIDAQTYKIRDLEGMLHEKKDHLDNVEHMLQHELMTRSNLETQKLDLMTEISRLKMRLSNIERGKVELESRARQTEMELSSQLSEREQELSLLKGKGVENNRETSAYETGLSVSSAPPAVLHKPYRQNAFETERLRKTLESVMVANDEKDRKIDELRNAVARYKRLQELVATASGSKYSFDEPMHDNATGFTPCVIDKSTTECKAAISSRVPLSPLSTSSPLQHVPKMNLSSALSVSNHENQSYGSMAVQNLSCRSSTEETGLQIPHKTPPMKMRHGVVHTEHGGYSTLPRNLGHVGNPTAAILAASPTDSYRSLHNSDLDNFRVRQKPSGLSFVTPETGVDGIPNSISPQPSPLLSDGKRKNKGLRKIFGRKLKRSSSQHLERENVPDGEFKRGGIRSTAGARLAWTKDLKSDRHGLNVPFARWDNERVAAWLHDMGLTMYLGECKRWVKSGDHLLRATLQDLEKELGMKNTLHRKKLQLALQAVGSECEDHLGKLDHNWVTRWLDDVGLPQYKEGFSEARVDGRVLNRLTVEDLICLRVTNLLHHLSIKRGIQILREYNFDPTCLKRRPSPDEHTHPPLPTEVALWTNHRVMEWLRSVDLSEYAPNLRGSGVHGGLMVHEPKFQSELLATLLSIPPSKTLLRRHLSTHFKQLVGMDTVQQKREYEAMANYSPLTPNTKVKAGRRGQFALIRKKSKNEMDLEDLVCPVSPNATPKRRETRGLHKSLENSDDGETTRKIGDVSEEISSLTTKLDDERYFAEMSTTNV